MDVQDCPAHLTDPAPAADAPRWLPRVVVMSCWHTRPGDVWDWHEHPYDEVCLVDGDGTTIGHAGREVVAGDGWLFLARRGERHRFRNGPRQKPRLWGIEYLADEDVYRQLPALADPDPRKRVWRLTPDRVRAFTTLATHVLGEHRAGAPDGGIAESAWLRLLLATIARWAGPAPVEPTPPQTADGAVLALWRAVVADAAGDVDTPSTPRPRATAALRARFRAAFGVPPRALEMRLRMERAKNLLLDPDLAVAEVAARVGYARQHEFARAFHRYAGLAPSAWRRQPDGFDHRTVGRSLARGLPGFGPDRPA